MKPRSILLDSHVIYQPEFTVGEEGFNTVVQRLLSYFALELVRNIQGENPDFLHVYLGSEGLKTLGETIGISTSREKEQLIKFFECERWPQFSLRNFYEPEFIAEHPDRALNARTYAVISPRAFPLTEEKIKEIQNETKWIMADCFTECKRQVDADGSFILVTVTINIRHR